LINLANVMDNLNTGTEKDFSWKEVGWRIRNLRLACGMSQTALASATNLTSPGVFVIEKGEINPQLKTLQAIAKALGVSVRQLLTGSTDVRTDHDDLLEQMHSVLASQDQAAIFALLNGLQSAQLLLQTRGKGRGGLSVKPSEEVLHMFEVAGGVSLDDIKTIRHRLGKQSSKDVNALRDKGMGKSLRRRDSSSQKENKEE
jgi:transcriptional regulator with XRE-family HTH domain